MKKPADNKLPLPPRYRDNPTTGEVLYEYICASEKLRAAATLHVCDAMLQRESFLAVRKLDRLMPEDGDESTQSADADVAAKKAAEAFAFAHEFREEMRLYGLTLPLDCFRAIPCRLLAGGDSLDLISGGFATYSDLLILLSGLRFDELSKGAGAMWAFAVQPVPQDAMKSGRPSLNEGLLSPKSALNDLWYYLIVRAVAKHTGQDVETLLAPDDRQGRPQAEMLAPLIESIFVDADIEAAKKHKGRHAANARLKGWTNTEKGHGGKLDVGPIKRGARNAAAALKSLEDACPDVSLDVAEYAADICHAARDLGFFAGETLSLDANIKAADNKYGINNWFRVQKLNAYLQKLPGGKSAMIKLP